MPQNNNLKREYLKISASLISLCLLIILLPTQALAAKTISDADINESAFATTVTIILKNYDGTVTIDVPEPSNGTTIGHKQFLYQLYINDLEHRDYLCSSAHSSQ